MDIYYTSGLNQKFLSFLVHYISSYLPEIPLGKLIPIHVVRTCLSNNCMFHTEHKLDDSISNIVHSDKSLLALKEPLEGQDTCIPLLNDKAVILSLTNIETIDELVWKLVHALGHLFLLPHCGDKTCAMSNKDFPGREIVPLPLDMECKKLLLSSLANYVIE